MKFYMVETQSIVNYKYLIPVADEGYGAQAGKLAIDTSTMTSLRNMAKKRL